jgi:collagenase-like PrtC family protease
MKLSVPANWDDAFIESLSPQKAAEVRGKAEAGLKARHAGHIRAVRAKGFSFNYLLDEACLDNREWGRNWQRGIENLLDRLAACGADRLTVSVPYLLELIKKRFPLFKVNVSGSAHIDCAARARLWLELGADSLTLSSVRVNRDFGLLKSISAAVSCELRLSANTPGLLNCPFSFHHPFFGAHRSGAKTALFDYDLAGCRRIYLCDPAMLLKATWIRPEDAGFYNRLGADMLELSGSSLPEERLKILIDAYYQGAYRGNLFDLLLWENKTEAGKDVFRVDNAKLDGFIEKLYQSGCNGAACGECRFCAEKAREAVEFDEEERLYAFKRQEDILKELLPPRGGERCGGDCGGDSPW